MVNRNLFSSSIEQTNHPFIITLKLNIRKSTFTSKDHGLVNTPSFCSAVVAHGIPGRSHVPEAITNPASFLAITPIPQRSGLDKLASLFILIISFSGFSFLGPRRLGWRIDGVKGAWSCNLSWSIVKDARICALNHDLTSIVKIYSKVWPKPLSLAGLYHITFEKKVVYGFNIRLTSGAEEGIPYASFVEFIPDW